MLGLAGFRRPVLQEISSEEAAAFWRASDPVTNFEELFVESSRVSPEEMIIKQRGRGHTPPQSMKNIRTSSPKARPTFTCSSTPRGRGVSELCRRRLRVSLPQSPPSTPKRRRLSLPVVPVSPINNRLTTCTNSQLTQILKNLLRDHPELEKEVLDVLPRPNLIVMEGHISHLCRCIFRSLPLPRFGGTNRDADVYSSVQVHLQTFKEACTKHMAVLLEGGHLCQLLDHALTTWKYVAQLPNWDNPSHNTLKTFCFRQLAVHAFVAMKSSKLSPEYLAQVLPRLEWAASINHEILPCLEMARKLSSKETRDEAVNGI